MCLFFIKMGRDSACLIVIQNFGCKLPEVFVASLSLPLRPIALCSLVGLLLQLVLLAHKVKEVSCYGPDLFLRKSLSLGLSKFFLCSLLQLSDLFQSSFMPLMLLLASIPVLLLSGTILLSKILIDASGEKIVLQFC